VYTFVMQPLPVAERVVAANGDQHVDADVLEVLQDVLRDVVDPRRVAAEVRRDPRLRQAPTTASASARASRGRSS
jgi:hypothetical protein